MHALNSTTHIVHTLGHHSKIPVQSVENLKFQIYHYVFRLTTGEPPCLPICLPTNLPAYHTAVFPAVLSIIIYNCLIDLV